MRNYLSVKRQVARTHFKSLLIVGLLAGTAAAQQLPPTLTDIPSLPDLPAHSSLPCSTTLPTIEAAPKWTAGQHAAWILGLRVRNKALVASQTAAHASSLPLLPSTSQSAADDIKLPGPANDSMIAQVQFVDQGLPEVPEELRRGSNGLRPQPLDPSSSEPNSEDSASEPASDKQPAKQYSCRIGSGPIIAAPAAAMPLDAINGQDGASDVDSLLNVDLSGIDPAMVNEADSLDSNQVAAADESLIDGLVMPTASEDQDEPELDAMDDHKPSKPLVAAANVAIHEGFTPRKVEEPYLAPIVEAAKLNDSGDARWSKSPAASLAVAETKADEPAEVNETKLSPAPLLVQSPAIKLPVADQPTQVVSTELPTLEPISVEREESDPTPAPTVQAAPALAKLVEAATPVSEDKRLSRLTPAPTSTAPSTASPVVTPVEVPAETSAKSNLFVAAQLIAEEAPAGNLPIVAAPKMKLSEAKAGRPAVRGGSTAVKPASAVVPDDDFTIEGDEQVNFARLAGRLSQAVKQRFPDSRVRITSNEDGLIVDGTVADSAEATKIMAFVRKSSLCPAVDRLNCKR